MNKKNKQKVYKAIDRISETIHKVEDTNGFKKYTYIALFFLVAFAPLLILSCMASIFLLPYFWYQEQKKNIVIPDFTSTTTQTELT